MLVPICQTKRHHIQEDHKNLKFITVSPGKLQVEGRRHFPHNFPMHHWMGQPSAQKEEACLYEDIHPEGERDNDPFPSPLHSTVCINGSLSMCHINCADYT
jgi:hypothetical protein